MMEVKHFLADHQIAHCVTSKQMRSLLIFPIVNINIKVKKNENRKNKKERNAKLNLKKFNS